MPEQIQEAKQEYVIKRENAKVITNDITASFDDALNKYEHLRGYVNEISLKIGPPEWMTSLDFSLRSRNEFNILYPVGDPIFIHIYKLPSRKQYNNVIEPELNDNRKEKIRSNTNKIVKYSIEDINFNNIEEVRRYIVDLFNKVIDFQRRKLFSDKVYIKIKRNMINYYIS